MSRVFLATETDLGRKVVVKVLPPDMAAGVNKERFQREIKLAASLQHPHIVPLLTAGTADGDLLYYVMPYIEGESLRSKLQREGELPIGEASRILREVVDALAYAHRQDVVHRDIKPDNILLTDDHALVADFGVAKAVSASSGGTHSSLTSLGVALGTPAYMSPEQAAADPHVDHRADIYAVGALAYEMLTGRPPFSGSTPQQVLAAHVNQTPEPITQHRDTIPPQLAELVMRCLAKRPADRWQTAGELKAPLGAMATPPSGGVTPTGTQPVASVAPAPSLAVATRNHPVRVAALFGVAAATTLVLVYASMIGLGLPDWVFVGAVALIAIGLPIILVTGHHERRRAVSATTGLHVPTPTGVRRHFTWRKAILGGVMGFAALTVGTVAFMGMRAAGIGPAATLMSAGVLEDQERLILADFENGTSDPTLGETVTALLRIALAQSPTIVVLEPAQVSEIVSRMERPDALVPADVARDAAVREGIKAYLSGEVRSVGSGYVITARLIAATTEDALVSERETVSNADEIVAAVDRLSASIRERIGESLRSVRADPPLERVTTASMEALRLYVQGTRLYNLGDVQGGIDLLEKAVDQDTAFAMAYRRLGAYLGNPEVRQDARARGALGRAYELRERVSDRERYHIEGLYNNRVTLDFEASATAYRALLDKYPNDATALNNFAVTLGYQLGRFAEAEEVARRAIATGAAPALTYMNAVAMSTYQGDYDGADAGVAAYAERYPDHPQRFINAAQTAAARFQYSVAQERLTRLREVHANNLTWMAAAAGGLQHISATRGRVKDADAWRVEQLRINAERLGLSREEREARVEWSRLERNWWLGAAEVAVQDVEDLWQRHASLNEPASRNYDDFAPMFAHLGNAARASQLRAELVLSIDPDVDAGQDALLEIDAAIALAEDRPLDAVPLLHERRERMNAIYPTDFLWELAFAFDRAEQRDSAVTYYRRYLETPAMFRWRNDRFRLAPALRRLGELYEERNDPDTAVSYYSRFVELWANADPELQPVVDDVEARIARLVGQTR